ncbi:MAG: hypothetical protein F4X38_01775 [Acidimicrobiaceae bacterium]|nr:hypothetical protein [Acidimicrobiaceae bacterium]MXV98484.1 hypothetical protein [Acidimicrobiaceae bacterium]MYB27842.1 hypothetical protein [Acidimicrobiaceae bacterium]
MLRLIADGQQGWGFALWEESPAGLEPVASVSPERAGPLRRAVTSAATTDGYSTEAVGQGRRRPFNLTQTPGVRLALTTLSALPMRCPQRRAAVLAGVESLGDEECLYWYAKARGSAGNRALRALRLLLADG